MPSRVRVLRLLFRWSSFKPPERSTQASLVPACQECSVRIGLDPRIPAPTALALAISTRKLPVHRFRMISTTSPTVRRWCVFCVTCRTSKTARKAHICGSSRVATLCVTSAPFSQRASGRGAAHAGASLPDSLPRSPSTTDPPWHLVRALRCEMCRPQGCGRSTPACRLYALHARQSLSAPGRVVLFHHRPRHRRVVLPVPLVYGPTTARARCRAEHLRLCPSRSMD